MLVVVDCLYYVVKVNMYLVILKVIVEEGFGFECVLLGELKVVMVVVLEGVLLLFMLNFVLCEDYVWVLIMWVIVLLDLLYLLEYWGDIFCGCEIVLWLDLGCGLGYYEKVCIGGSGSKFGLLVE